ncbi:MAG: hypothetical protein JRJ87_19030 [Deltaproteobacteria bacterium]|nr:hypothetical protein [Deltaproteobacteria bacterium]
MFFMFQLTRAPSLRAAFYPGIVIGLLLMAPQLWFFWNLFGSPAAVLWLIKALWIAAFLFLSHLCITLCRRGFAVVMVACLWTALEYTRSELYILKFSWLIPGYALSHSPDNVALQFFGMYGIAFWLILLVGILALHSVKRAMLAGCIALILFGVLTCLPESKSPSKSNGPLFVGIQLESPQVHEVIEHLNKALEKHPQADLLVLSEYTFMREIPAEVIAWCQEKKRFLILGAVDYLPTGKKEYFNTAFVISPKGQIVFKQAKSVPVQLFRDGLPATSQNLWNSPWGKIGICICYDLSYTRVTDELVRMGAQAIIVPTMDAASWGEQEHVLHARVAPIRAAEYGIPIFRVASSGISQAVNKDGIILDSAPFPGQGEMIASHLRIKTAGTIPIDRYLVYVALCLGTIWILILPWLLLKNRKANQI